MVKILLINCVYLFRSEFETKFYKFLRNHRLYYENFYYPLGVLYIASNMIKNGLEVDVLDLATCYPENIEKVVRQRCRGYDLVGISFYSLSYPLTLKIAKICKELNPYAKIVFGGPHATFEYENILKNSYVDYVISGEGEMAFTDLVLGKDPKNIQNLRYRENGKIRVNPIVPIKNLDELPFPAIELSKPIDVKYSKIYGMITSRGCPNRCIYCVESRLFPTVRFRSAKNVVDEMNINNFSSMFILDSDFFISKIHIKKICNEIIKRKVKKDFFCNAHIDNITADSLFALKKCGLHGIEIGVESLNISNLNFINKTKDPENYKRKLLRIIRLCKELKIILIFNYVLGLPFQTRENVEKELNFLRKFGVTYLAMLNPYPGTYYWNKYKDFLSLEDYEKLDTAHLIINESQLKIEDFKYFFEKNSFLEQWLRKKVLERIVENPLEIFQIVKDFKNINPES